MNKHKLEIYIKNKQQSQKEYLIFNRVPLFIKDKLISNFTIPELIKALENVLTPEFAQLVKTVIILKSNVFLKKQINAMYNSGNIYISNEQDDLADAIDDVVHEYAHALEENYKDYIYKDSLIKNEFLKKRKQLKTILKTYNYDTEEINFLELNYNKKLDNYLLNVIGYEKFKNLTNYGLFLNPYAATSIREYFATGFEEYILGDVRELKRISPDLYMKIKDLNK